MVTSHCHVQEKQECQTQAFMLRVNSGMVRVSTAINKDMHSFEQPQRWSIHSAEWANSRDGSAARKPK